MKENILDCETTDMIFLKETLMNHINEHLQENKLSQNDAAKILCIPQSKVSSIKKLRHTAFSVGRLFRFLNSLGYQVIIEIKDKEKDI